MDSQYTSRLGARTPSAFSEDEDADANEDASDHSSEHSHSGDSPTHSHTQTPLIEVAGLLCKWTNYLNGWQDRYFILKGGVLSYYRSASEVHLGCRGSVCLQRAHWTPHVYDDCRLDVAVGIGGEQLWYLRMQRERQVDGRARATQTTVRYEWEWE